jgi:hypothetical protein
MKQRFKLQNFYKTTIQNIIQAWDPNDTTEKSFQVAEAPVKAPLYVIIDYTDVSKKDIIYIHRLDWNTLYYYEYNRTNPSVEHNSWAICQVNDLAEYFNYIFDNIDDFWYIKKKHWLDIEVKWWLIKVNNNDVTVDDSTITLTDNTTNYVIFDYTDNSVKAVTSTNWLVWIILWIVNTNWW